MISPLQEVVLMFACTLLAEHFLLESNFYDEFLENSQEAPG
jgi:hypothetical protein